ncbi:hypothetical protein [Reinekea sp. G2M2-21]|uniref:hypothetical protein n=1 Tax=Reinekea sp. G2M2-21 TaxID=2788942 RepID=UPI0018A9A53B|nr:hypothetical protein [Reinekea sp. G2M2-21]
MKNIGAVVFVLSALMGCNPEGPGGNGTAAEGRDCSDPFDPNGYIAAVNTTVGSSADGSNANRPLDMSVTVDVSLSGVLTTDIEAASFFYPDGTEVSSSYLNLNDYNGSRLLFYNAFFESYTKVNGLRVAPMTGYCAEVTLKDGTVFSANFSLERSDGSEPNEGELFVHANDYNSVTAGGDYSKALAIPVINSASMSESALTFTMTIMDSRVTEYDVVVRSNEGFQAAEYLTDDAASIKNDGEKTYVIDYANLDTDLTPAELVAASNYLFVLVYDAGTGKNGFRSSMAELSANSATFDF